MYIYILEKGAERTYKTGNFFFFPMVHRSTRVWGLERDREGETGEPLSPITRPGSVEATRESEWTGRGEGSILISIPIILFQRGETEEGVKVMGDRNGTGHRAE